MFRYYIFFGALTAFIILVVIAGVIVVNPGSKREATFDKTRLDNFREIKSRIENYYSANNSLPNSLDEIIEPDIIDPETKESYEYKTLSHDSYELCAVFSTEDSIIKKNYDSDSPLYMNHKKGHDCLTFEIPNYLKKIIPTPALKTQKGSTLLVNSFPTGIVMTPSINSNNSEFGGKTGYAKKVQGAINETIDAPENVVIEGKNYFFSSWTGCNNDTVADRYCTVYVNGETRSIYANYVASQNQ